MRARIARERGASSSILAEIERELEREPSADLWVLRGDAIQLSDGDGYDLRDAERSYFRALELDSHSGEAYEALGHFTFAAMDNARGSLQYFQRAIELGAGESAREGLREAMDEITELGE